MPDTKTDYPNYDEMKNSPSLNGPGVAMNIDPPTVGSSYDVGEPIYMHGIVGANGKQHAQSDGEILIKAYLKAIRKKDRKEVTFPVRDGDNVTPEEVPEPKDADAYEVYAWFNVDLRKHLKLPDEPGEYTVSLGFFEFESEPETIIIEFKTKNES